MKDACPDLSCEECDSLNWNQYQPGLKYECTKKAQAQISIVRGLHLVTAAFIHVVGVGVRNGATCCPAICSS